MSMVNEKQPFSLRCAVLYCVQSFLFKVLMPPELKESIVVKKNNNTFMRTPVLC
jgi:hypothetical protein